MNLQDDWHLQFFIDNAPIGIAILDAPGCMIEIINEKFQEIIDLPKEAILGRAYWSLFAEAKLYYEPLIQSVFSSGKPYFSDEMAWYVQRKGKRELIFISFVYSPIKNSNGQITKLAVWVLDNSKQVMARKEINNLNLRLVESTERVKAMIQASPVAFLVTRGEKMIFEEFNQAVLDMMGKTSSIKGKPWFEAVPELKGQAVIEQLYHTYRTGERLQVQEVPITMNRNGVPYNGLYNITYSALIENETITGVLQSVIDVTMEVTARRKVEQLYEELAAVNEELVASNEELTQANQELEETHESLKKALQEAQASEKKLQIAIAAGNMGTWSVDVVTLKPTLSAFVSNLLGFSAEEEVTMDMIMSVIKPAYREMLMDTLKNAIEKGQQSDSEYSLINARSGQEKWVKATGTLFYDKDGHPAEYAGILMEIPPK